MRTVHPGGVVPVSALSKRCSCCQMMPWCPPPSDPLWVERVNLYNGLVNRGSLQDISPMFFN